MMTNNKDLEYYLNLNWSYRFEWSHEDNCYIASIAELQGCKTDGKTIEEAIGMIKDALKSYISTCLEFGDAIPEPARPSDFKGNITFRTTPELHYKLHQRATSEGKSINKIIEETISKEIA